MSGDTGGTVWDSPNKQVLGLDPPWVEGTGGGEEAQPKAAEQSLTKAELLEQAQARGLDVDDTNTKAEIKAALEDNS
jgi:hypothetical protein